MHHDANGRIIAVELGQDAGTQRPAQVASPEGHAEAAPEGLQVGWTSDGAAAPWHW